MGDPREVQERINWELDSSRKHAHGHDTRNEERHVPSIACNLEEKALETDDDLGTNT